MINNNLDILDTLAILSTILQMRNYQAELQSADNDDIMRELQRQDRLYFERIVQNQELILKKLDNLQGQIQSMGLPLDKKNYEGGL